MFHFPFHIPLLSTVPDLVTGSLVWLGTFGAAVVAALGVVVKSIMDNRSARSIQKSRDEIEFREAIQKRLAYVEGALDEWKTKYYQLLAEHAALMQEHIAVKARVAELERERARTMEKGAS